MSRGRTHRDEFTANKPCLASIARGPASGDGQKNVPQMERPGFNEFLKLDRARSDSAAVRNRTKLHGDDMTGAQDASVRKTVEFSRKRVRSVVNRDSKAPQSACTPNPQSGRSIRPEKTGRVPTVLVLGWRLIGRNLWDVFRARQAA